MAAVEFALIMPILLALVFGIIDFGAAYNRKITESQAAREGARLAALGNPTTAVKSRTQLAGTGLSLATTDIKVCYRAAADSSPCTADTPSPVCSSGLAGDAVVTVQQAYRFITPIVAIANLANSSLTLTATGRMPCGG